MMGLINAIAQILASLAGYFSREQLIKAGRNAERAKANDKVIDEIRKGLHASRNDTDTNGVPYKKHRRDER